MGRTKMVGGNDLIEKHANDITYRSVLHFAQELNKKYPTRSVHGWRSKITRWGGTFLRQNKDKDTTTTLVGGVSIVYDKKKDCYLSVIPGTSQIISIEGETHRAMRKAYSNDGSGMSAEQMSREFNLPKQWLGEYVRANGWTHHMDVFTDEEMTAKTTDDLVEEVIASKRNRVLEKANKKYWKQLEKDADNYRALETTLLLDFKALINEPFDNFHDFDLEDSNAPYAVVISPTDLHYGKGAWADEVGEEYTLEEARKRLIDQTFNLIQRLPGRPEKIILATGSDWFHVDNEEGSTTKGTPQDMSASPARILMDGCKLAREHIELLSRVAPVEVVFMRGNHDRHSSLALMMYLSAVYEDKKNVTVNTDPKLRQYICWGNNLLGFTHGDGVRGNDLPAIMSVEERQNWGATEHHTWFHGHLHHQKMTEMNGAMILQLPSLAGHDRWHYQKGYTMNKAGLCAHLVDEKLGVIGSLFAPVV